MVFVGSAGFTVALWFAEAEREEVKEASRASLSDISPLELRPFVGWVHCCDPVGMRTDSGGCVLATLIG